jgi:hypothetical protein
VPVLFPVVAKRNWRSRCCGEGRRPEEAAIPRPVGGSQPHRGLETQERVGNDPADKDPVTPQFRRSKNEGSHVEGKAV